MKKTVLQSLLLLFFLAICFSVYLAIQHFLGIPFRSTNDGLHQKEAPITLDFLIPAGVYIDENMTIGEVLKLRFKKEGGVYDKMLKGFSEMVPARYRHGANGVLFIFWTFLFMTFLRVFSFMGYGRAIRVSLLLGACTYYFMPDFTPGKFDDLLFVAFALLIIAVRAYYHHKKQTNRVGK